MTERELTQVNGEWIIEIPDAEIREYDGRLWQALPDAQSDVITLGVAPAPKTVWQTLVYHVCHGLLMRYPLHEVLVWSWRNRRSFVEPEVRDALELE